MRESDHKIKKLKSENIKLNETIATLKEDNKTYHREIAILRRNPIGVDEEQKEAQELLLKRKEQKVTEGKSHTTMYMHSL